MAKKRVPDPAYVLKMEAHCREKMLINRSFLHGAKFFTALEALEFGYKLHPGKRKDGSPEFMHQLIMAEFTFNLVDDLEYPEETIATIYLHDSPEENRVTHEIIRAKFGDRIADPVYLLDKHRYPNRILTAEEYHDPMSECPITSAVKPVDRSHNLGTMTGAFSRAKKIEYVTETEDHVMPMLHKAFHNNPRQIKFYGVMHHTLRLQIETNKNYLKMK